MLVEQSTTNSLVGLIPTHWKQKKGKWLFKKMERPVNPSDEVITCFRDGQVTLRSNRKTDGFTNALKEIGYQGIRKGDLVIHNMDAFAGAIGVSEADGKATPVYSVCVPQNRNEAIPEFYALLLRILAKNGFINSLAKGIRERSTDFRFADFGELLLPLPPYHEQRQIVDFLAEKTALIDKAIAIKERQIELLKERRQILIQQAVTKGLDPNVEMKEIRSQWIKKIPVGWQSLKIKFIFNIQGGGTPNRARTDYWNGDIPWLSPKDMKRSDIIDTEEYITEKGLTESTSKIVPENSLVIVVRSGILQRIIPIAINLKPISINQDIKSLSPKIPILPKYYLFLVETNSEKLLAEWVKQGATVESIEMQLFENTILPVPPISEQTIVCEYAEKINQQTEKATKLLSTEIEALVEYKNTLINSAVTGKVKVA